MKADNKVWLDSEGKKLPFSVPENYFEQFASNIEVQIGYKPVVKRKIIMRSWMYAVAAVFVGMVILTPIYKMNKSQKTVTGTTDNYESYVLSQVDETAMMDYYVDQNSADK